MSQAVVGWNSVESGRRAVRRIGVACLLGMLTCSVGHTHAQDEPDAEPNTSEQTAPPNEQATAIRDEALDFELDPVVITATRTEKPLFESPFAADVITENDIDKALYRTTPEALRDTPGVMVQKTAHGHGSPYIRGFTSFRTLMLIDGIRLNNSVFRPGPNQYWNTIDPNSIERLEVIKGPSSVLYGSDAIGGTVNAITKGPGGYGESVQFGGRGFYRVSSAERSHTFRGELNLTYDDTFGLFSGGTYKQFGDLQAGDGRKPKTGYSELAGDFKFEYFVNPETRFVFAHQRVDQDDIWRTHKTIFAESFDGTTIGDERRRVLFQNRDLTYLQLHAEEIGGFVDAARFSVSYHSQEERRNRVRSDGRRDVQGFDADTFGVWGQFESPSPIGLWTYGFEYYRDDVDTFRRDFNANGSLDEIRIQGPVADDANYELVGLYLQNDINVTDSLNLILGGRFNYARADADRVADPGTGQPFSITEDFESVVGSARFVQWLDDEEHWNLFGGVSQGFRAPNLSDLTRFDTARTNEIETPAPGLDPEQYISYEIGTKFRTDDLLAQASYYYTNINDMIIRTPTGNVIEGDNEVTKRNSGDGFIHGVELQGSWRFHPNFTAFGSFAWLEGTVETFPDETQVQEDEPISRMMPAIGRFGLRWQPPEQNLWLEGLVTISGGQDRLSTRDENDTQRIPPGGTPGYTVLSLRGGWRVNENLRLTGTIDNVTDETYRVHGSGVNEPGVNFILGVQYNF